MWVRGWGEMCIHEGLRRCKGEGGAPGGLSRKSGSCHFGVCCSLLLLYKEWISKNPNIYISPRSPNPKSSCRTVRLSFSIMHQKNRCTFFFLSLTFKYALCVILGFRKRALMNFAWGCCRSLYLNVNPSMVTCPNLGPVCCVNPRSPEEAASYQGQQRKRGAGSEGRWTAGFTNLFPQRRSH